VWRRTNRRLKDDAPKGGGFYHHARPGTKEFTDNKIWSEIFSDQI
jgi:hypothetical protein